MLLVIDVGNTNIVYGLFDGQTLVGIVSPSDVSRAVEQATLRREHQPVRIGPIE